jgi:hypothetical protein
MAQLQGSFMLATRLAGTFTLLSSFLLQCKPTVEDPVIKIGHVGFEVLTAVSTKIVFSLFWVVALQTRRDWI